MSTQWLAAAGPCFSSGALVSSTNKTDCHNIQVQCNWNIVESGVKHHNPNPVICSTKMKNQHFWTVKPKTNRKILERLIQAPQ
jgi:hypothetical protein